MSSATRREFVCLAATGTVLLGYQPAAAASLLRSRPYLQYVGNRRATILWTSFTDDDVAVELSHENGAKITATVRSIRLNPDRTGRSATYYRYRADAIGLDPGQSYTYRVLVNGHDVTPAGHVFRTDDGNPFSFLAFGDSGMSSDGQLAIAQRINSENVSLALPLGDLAYPIGTYKQLEESYFGVYAPLMERAPFFATPGNHDYYQEEAAPFLDSGVVPADGVRPEDVGRYYSFDWGPVHFVSIDSNTPLEACALGQDAMLRWLEKDLSLTRKFWRIAYMHHPPYAAGAHEFEIETQRVRQYLVPIFEKYGVQLVLSGHEHSYQRTKPMRDGAPADRPDSIVYVTSGGAGAWLYQHTVRSHMEVGRKEFHYLMAEVDDGKLAMRAVPSDGADLDAFVLKPKPYLRGDVLSAASGSPNVAEGGLATIFGRNLCFAEVRNPNPQATAIRGTSVTLNGQPVRATYVSPDQVNILLPAGETGEMTLKIATPNGSVTKSLIVSPAAPAIFANENGPLIFHEDRTQVTAVHPVQLGEPISIYLTGMGSQPNGVSVAFNDTRVPAVAGLTNMPGVSLVRVHVPSYLLRPWLDVTVYVGWVASNLVGIPTAAVPPSGEINSPNGNIGRASL